MGAPLLASVPIGSLVGLMLVVCHSTFSWSSLRLLGRIPAIDTLVLAIVSAIVVWKDLAVAVVVGTILSALSFAWTQSKRVTLDVSDTATTQTYGSMTTTVTQADGSKSTTDDPAQLITVEGLLFFGSARHLQQLFAEEAPPDPAVVTVVLDFLPARILDLSAVEAIRGVATRFGGLGKRVVLRHLPPALADLLRADAPPYLTVESDKVTDPSYSTAAVGV